MSKQSKQNKLQLDSQKPFNNELAKANSLPKGRDNSNKSAYRKQGKNKSGNNKYHKSKFPPKGTNQYDASGIPQPQAPKSSMDNNISWYSYDPNILANAAKVTFASPLGLKVGYDAYGVKTQKGSEYSPNNTEVVPGILSLNINMHVGIATSGESPINQAAQRIYTFMRKSNNKANLRYDRADVILAIGAVSQFYAIWNWAARIYRVMNTPREALNRYKPEYVIRAMNVDFDDVNKNMANFRMRLNYFANAMQSLPVPGDIKLFTRQCWLMQTLFKDASSLKAQLYLFNPEGYYVYSPKTSSQGGQLVYNKIRTAASATTPLTSSRILGILQEMFDAIIDDTDIGDICADIQNAYGQLASISYIQEDEVLQPEYSEEVLSQIHNAVILPEKNPTDSDWEAVLRSWDISQVVSTLNLKFEPKVCVETPTNTYAERAYPLTLPLFFNSRFDSPNPADIMIASRLMTMLSMKFTGVPASKVYTIAIAETGTETVMSGEYFAIHYTANGSSLARRKIYGSLRDDDFTTVDAALNHVANVTTFDWLPNIYVISSDKADVYRYKDYADLQSSVCLHGIICDINNYTLMDPLTLRNLHLVAISNEVGLKF